MTPGISKGFIDDSDRQAARRVLFGEWLALNHADAKGSEVFRSHHIEARARARGGIVNRLAGEVKGHAEVHADNGHAGGGGDSGDSRQSAELIQELAVKGVDLFGMGKAFVGDWQKEGEDVVLPETEIHTGQFPETVDHEAGTGEERESQGELDDDQGAPQAVAASAG